MRQELKVLGETREGLDDQIERLQWSLARDDHESGSHTLLESSSSAVDDPEDNQSATGQV